jgi:hypothetical protein
MMYPWGPQPFSFTLPLSELWQPAQGHYLPLKMATALYMQTLVELQRTILLTPNVKIIHIKILCHNYSYTHTLHTKISINPRVCHNDSKMWSHKKHKIYEVCKIYRIIAIQATVTFHTQYESLKPHQQKNSVYLVVDC